MSLQASELSLKDASFIQNELRQPTSDLSNSLLTYLTETDVDRWHPLYKNSIDIVQRFIEDHAMG
ncbi:MAG: hypothetical protein O3A77_04795, partial [bacterium]|nr:hypothetical protein [bacterium]